MRRLVLAAVVSCAGGAAAPSPPPRAATSVEAVAVARNESCVSCHADEAAAWRGSMHRRSFTNAAFQTALAYEPTPFCRGCHAPEADPKAPAEAADIGVACVSCHAVATNATHPTTKSVTCARCHEFPFPGAPADDEARLMQATMREHARSSSANEACETCHRSHAFDEVRDASWLASQLDVRTALEGRGATITLAQTRAGHGFPTGNLFRRLAVTTETRAADGRVLAKETRYLARHFEVNPGHGGRQVVADDRVFDAPVSVELPVAPGGATVAWSVKLERVGALGHAPASASIESEVVLHSGVLVR